MNQYRTEKWSLENALNLLVGRIKTIIYDNNFIFREELERVDRLYSKLDVKDFVAQLGKSVFSSKECERFLDAGMIIKVYDKDVATLAIADFMKNLRYFENTFVMKIIYGEIRCKIDVKPRATPSQTVSSSYLDRIKTVRPYSLIKEYEIPEDLVARDILYVACQLTNYANFQDVNVPMDDDDRNAHMDSLSRLVINIAREFQMGHVTERNALQMINYLVFKLIHCIPIDFFERFIYHPDNEYFGSIRFISESLNAAARVQMIKDHDKLMCTEERFASRHDKRIIETDLKEFMDEFENKITEFGKAFKLMDNVNLELAKVGAKGVLVSKTGNKAQTNPDPIKNVYIQFNEKLDVVDLNIVSYQAPSANVAQDEIQKAIAEIEPTIAKHAAEADHFEKSIVVPAAKEYVLQPAAISRKNYWQCRGNETPKWFPGFHHVFPNWNEGKVVPYPLDQILTHAWRMMAPIHFR